MNDWIITLEGGMGQVGPDMAQRIVADFPQYAPAVSLAPGRLGLTIAIEAETVQQAFANGALAWNTILQHYRLALDQFHVEITRDDEVDRELARPTFPELLGVAEVAQVLGVSKQRIYELEQNPAFPPPAAILKAGPVWMRTQIDAFLASWYRRPGRKPSVATGTV